MLMENKTVFIVIGIALLLIELEIFAVAAMKSGRDYKLQFYTDKGNLIHEADGKSLSDFNKYYFEKTFGPAEQYEIRLATKDKPFPFRAWFVAAMGIPIGIILLFAFVVKAYISLFYGDEDDETEQQREKRRVEYSTPLEKFIASISSFNIFVIGFLVFLAVIAYWIVPEVVVYLGKLGEDTILRYKWFFIAAFGGASCIIVWIVYLRYLLARRTIESQTEVNKYRIQLEFKRYGEDMPLQLEYEGSEADGAKPLIGWEEENNEMQADAKAEGKSSGSKKSGKTKFFKKKKG